jgi:molybdenum cofactor cytidylyltransferase
VIAGVLLAAGRSSRFGADKLLAPLGGRPRPVLRWSAESLLGGVDELYVVVPAGAVALRESLSGLHVHFVENAMAAEGMASSIRAGVAALPPRIAGAFVALGDQPLVPREVLHALRLRWEEGGADAVAPSYRDGRGNPVLFDRALFGALATLTGDAGARKMLDALGERLALVPVDAPMPVDVDTPDALRALGETRTG